MRAMRTKILASLLPLCLLVAGCGDDTTTAPDMSMPDLAPGPDLAMRTPDGVSCGQMTCPAGQSCCVMTSNNMVTGASCIAPNGQCSGSTLACDGPEDCGGGTGSGQYCCGTIQFSGGGPDAGAPTFNGGSAMCTSTCNFNFGSGSVTTRLCHQDVDCTGLTGPLGTMLDKCCTSTQAPGMHFCANTFGMGTGITCP